MDGYSVWDEASRDYDAERALQTQATLRVAANDLTVFVAQSQSAAEFGHRFALAAETVSRIAAENGVTESEVANHVYAQWKLLTAAEEDSDDSGPDTYCKNCGKSFNFNGQSQDGHCPLCGSSNLSDIERKRFASKTAVGMAKCQDCGGSNDLSAEGKDYCSDCADETDPEMTHEAGKPTKGSPEPKPENAATKIVNRVLFNGEPGFYGTPGESDENSRGPVRSKKWLDWDKAQKAQGDKTANLADSSCRSCDATGKTKDGKNSCGNCGGMGIVPAEVNAPKNASRKTAAEIQGEDMADAETWRSHTIDNPEGDEYKVAPKEHADALNARFEHGAGPVVWHPTQPNTLVHGPNNFWDGPKDVKVNGDGTYEYINPYAGQVERFDSSGKTVDTAKYRDCPGPGCRDGEVWGRREDTSDPYRGYESKGSCPECGGSGDMSFDQSKALDKTSRKTASGIKWDHNPEQGKYGQPHPMLAKAEMDDPSGYAYGNVHRYANDPKTYFTELGNEDGGFDFADHESAQEAKQYVQDNIGKFVGPNSTYGNNQKGQKGTTASRRTAVSAIDPEYAAKHLEVMPAERKGKFDSDGYPKRGDLDCPNCGSKEMEEGGDGKGRVDDRQCPDCGHQEFPVEGMRTKIPSTLDPKKISYRYSKVIGLKDDEGWENNDGSTQPAGDRAGHQVDALHDGEKVGHIKWLAEDSEADGGPGAILDVRLGEAHQGQGLTNKLLGAARDAWKNGKANTRPYIRDDNDLGYWSSDAKNGEEWPSNKADEAEYEKSDRTEADDWDEWHNKGQKGTTASRLNFNQASYKSISSNAKTSLEELRALVRQGAFDKISESNVPTPPADAHVKSTPDGGFQNPQEKLWSPVPGPPANNVMPTATDFNSANMDTANAVQSSLQKRVVAAVANQAIKDNPGLSVMAALALANETIDRFPAVIAEFTPLDFPPPTPPKNGPITDKFEKIRDELWSPSNKKKKKDGEEDDDEDEDSGFSLNLPRRGPRHKKDPSEDTERPSLREMVKQVGPAWRQLKDELKPKQPESEPAPADDDPWL